MPMPTLPRRPSWPTSCTHVCMRVLQQMSHEEGPLAGQRVKAPAWAAARVCWIAFAAFAAGCGNEPDGNGGAVHRTPGATTATDASGGMVPSGPQLPGSLEEPPQVEGSVACSVTRTPITSPDGALQDTIDRLVGSYPIGGTWAALAQLEFAQKGASLEGELVVSRRDGDVVDLEGCGSGIEVPVEVALRTSDGALDERLEGVVLLDEHREVYIDGSPAPFRAELSAVVDLGALSGSFALADESTYAVRYSELQADLTSFGTRGMLGINIDPKGPSDGLREISPLARVPLLAWDGGEGCVGPAQAAEPALFPAPSKERAALDAALEMAAAETYRARYADGTETRVAVELDPVSLLCAPSDYWQFPTRVHLSTDDGRVDISIRVTIDPSISRLYYYQLLQGPWAYPPSRVDEEIGHIDVALTGYAHVGIESSFDYAPEPHGVIQVLGWNEGACIDCDESGGCSACAFAEQVELLKLTIGSGADEL